jgi:peptidoglycan/LPS O-acetylase OafA/YrhL
MSASHKNFIDVAWTLSYEVWFYLVFACCIILGARKAKRIYFIWTAVILFKKYTHIGDVSPVLNFILNPMILYFLAGCMVAWIVRKEALRLKPVHFMTLLLVFSSLLFAYAGLAGSPLDELRRDINYFYLFIALFGTLLWAAADADLYSAVPSPSKWLLLIGDASYSIYLIHPAIIMLCYKIAAYGLGKLSMKPNGLTANLVFVGTAIAALLVGISLHLFIEKPLLAFFNKEKRRPFVLKPAMVKEV